MSHLRPWLTLPVILLLALPTTAQAQQLVAFDEVYTATEKGNIPGETFHYAIKPRATEPASWVTPVNYSRGTAYVHLEVLEKPSKRNTAITICFDGDLAGYGCIATNAYTDVGVYLTKRELPADTWQYGKIAWGKRRAEYHLVVKDPNLGGAPGGKPASDFVPTKLRIALTVVPPGGTYTPPAGAAAPAVDGGAPGDGGTPTDAPSPPGGSTSDAASAPPPPASDRPDASATPDAAPTPSTPGSPTTPAPPASTPMNPPVTPLPSTGPGGGDNGSLSGGGCSVRPGAPVAGGASALLLLALVGLRASRRRDR